MNLMVIILLVHKGLYRVHETSKSLQFQLLHREAGFALSGECKYHRKSTHQLS